MREIIIAQVSFASSSPMFNVCKSSHLYLYSGLYNTDCFKAALQW